MLHHNEASGRHTFNLTISSAIGNGLRIIHFKEWNGIVLLLFLWALFQMHFYFFFLHDDEVFRIHKQLCDYYLNHLVFVVHCQNGLHKATIRNLFQ